MTLGVVNQLGLSLDLVALAVAFAPDRPHDVVWIIWMCRALGLIQEVGEDLEDLTDLLAVELQLYAGDRDRSCSALIDTIAMLEALTKELISLDVFNRCSHD